MKKVILKFNPKDFKKITSMNEFFNITGIMPYIKNKFIKDTKQMKMNKEDEILAFECWNKNWKKCKELKTLSEKYAKSRIAIEWLQYSPYIDEKVKSGEIHIFSEGRRIK